MPRHNPGTGGYNLFLNKLIIIGYIILPFPGCVLISDRSFK